MRSRPDDPEPGGAGCPAAAAWGLQLPGWSSCPGDLERRSTREERRPGRDGATATWQGYELREIKLTLRMWEGAPPARVAPHPAADHAPPGQASLGALSIDHVALDDYGISHVMVQKDLAAQAGRGPGEVEVTSRCAVARPFAGTGTGTSTPRPPRPGADDAVHEVRGGRPRRW